MADLHDMLIGAFGLGARARRASIWRRRALSECEYVQVYGMAEMMMMMRCDVDGVGADEMMADVALVCSQGGTRCAAASGYVCELMDGRCLICAALFRAGAY